MSLPIRSLPIVQNWDCHQGGSCCKEYQVNITLEEKQRIEAQQWEREPEFQGVKIFKRHGLLKARYSLNHRQDGSCVFLNEQGRCRIHERFGYHTKPLPCRMFPFVLIPAGDHWRLGMRFACPSAVSNLGRGVMEHGTLLREFAHELALREQLELNPTGFSLPPPLLQTGQSVAWPDLLLIVNSLLQLVQQAEVPLERRLRQCLALAELLRQAKLAQITGERLEELLTLLTSSVAAEVPHEASSIPPPSWVGRILFRQALALFTRKDQGPQRGAAIGSRIALLRAALRFVLGTGEIPQLHRWIPAATFEEVEARTGRLSVEAEALLERYYVVKLHSLQFCGPAFFGLHFWEGLNVLVLTFPLMLWVARTFREVSSVEALKKAMSIVDDHFGFNRLLGTMRQRFGFHLLSSTGELTKLVAWYGR